MARGLAPFPNGASPRLLSDVGAHLCVRPSSIQCRGGIHPALLSLRAPRSNLDSDLTSEAGEAKAEGAFFLGHAPLPSSRVKPESYPLVSPALEVRPKAFREIGGYKLPFEVSPG